jgi:hypothetical protein
MKQGPSTSRPGDQKREPISQSIDPGAVSQIGIHEVNTQPQPMVNGRGFSAPSPISTDVHRSGSQGHHK